MSKLQDLIKKVRHLSNTQPSYIGTHSAVEELCVVCEELEQKLSNLLKDSYKQGPEHGAFYFLYDGIESILSEIGDKNESM